MSKNEESDIMKIKDLKTKVMSLLFCSLLVGTTLALMFNDFNKNMAFTSDHITNINLKYSGIVNKTLFEDDFESGSSKWSSITGLWHMTNSSSSWPNSSHSTENSMWFGQESTGDYDTGGRVEGNLTSVSFDLSLVYQANLEFYHWRVGESGRDFSYVNISTDGNSWDNIYQTDLDISPWEKKIIDISTYCGNSSVMIVFYFDTGDGVNNDRRGWLVDDVRVTGLEVDDIKPVITAFPSNFTVEYGYTGQSLSWTATDLHPDTYTIELQGTGNVVNSTAWVNNTAVIYDIPDDFDLGDYIYIINFTDKGNNGRTSNVTFTVEDTTSPSITNAPNDFSVDFGYTGQSISWTATDPHPFNYTIELQGLLVAGPTNWTSGEAITYNISDGKAVDIYNYRVNFTDDLDNPITDNVTFTVQTPSPPNITDTPSDFAVEYGYSGESLSWTATDNHPINYTIELQGTGIVEGPTAWVSGNAITYNILTGYAIGDYIYLVNFTDDKGNYTTDSVTFTVQDTTDPTITVAPSDLTLAYGYTGESLSWTATDPHPVNYTIELQGTGVVAGPTAWISGNAVTFNIPDSLAAGVYVYNITLTDLYGNSVSDFVSVTVEAQPVSTDIIPLGNFYLLFIAIGIIVLITKIKYRKQ